MEDVDDFDFIAHVAYDAKPLTRRERAENVKKRDFLHKYTGAARAVIEALLDKYANEGITEITKTNKDRYFETGSVPQDGQPRKDSETVRRKSWVSECCQRTGRRDL